MNIPDTPGALIRIGFFIGIGLGLAYAVVAALFFCAILIAAPFIYIWDWLVDFSPGTPWAGPVLAIFLIIATLGTITYFTSIFKDQWVVLRNRTR